MCFCDKEYRGLIHCLSRANSEGTTLIYFFVSMSWRLQTETLFENLVKLLDTLNTLYT